MFAIYKLVFYPQIDLTKRKIKMTPACHP